MTKKKLSAFFVRRWWAYLLIPAAAWIIWFPLFRMAAQPPEEKILKLAFVGSGLDEEALERDLLSALSGQGLEAVQLDTINYANAETHYTAVWAGSQEADLMIFDEAMLPDDLAPNYFPALEWNRGNAGIYFHEGTSYGLYLGNTFAQYCTGDGGWVLFFTDAGLEKEFASMAADWLTEGT